MIMLDYEYTTATRALTWHLKKVSRNPSLRGLAPGGPYNSFIVFYFMSLNLFVEGLIRQLTE